MSCFSSKLHKFELVSRARVALIMVKLPSFGRVAVSAASPCFGYADNLAFSPDLWIIFNTILWPCSSEQGIVPGEFCVVMKELV